MTEFEFRLVRQLRTRTWGSYGLELETVRYVLQQRRVPHHVGEVSGVWQTCQEVDFDDLTLAEKAEIIDAAERGK